MAVTPVLKDLFPREHETWKGMRARCHRPTQSDYKNYGGRGIKVCERWQRFAVFLVDMGRRPPGMTIDRIDNDGNYEPENCKWATGVEQSRHTRQVKLNTEAAKVIRHFRGRVDREILADFYKVSAGCVQAVQVGATWA